MPGIPETDCSISQPGIPSASKPPLINRLARDCAHTSQSTTAVITLIGSEPNFRMIALVDLFWFISESSYTSSAFNEDIQGER
jgi:hypothetical protein